MHVLGYVAIFLATSYSAIYVFGLGWSVHLPPFTTALFRIVVPSVAAGLIAAIPKKSILTIAATCSVVIPANIVFLMLQAIVENRAFNQLHWVALVISSPALSVGAFMAVKKLMTTESRKPSQKKEGTVRR
jgi:hypothetical protein